MEKSGVPMNQYPQSPDLAHQQPPVYHQNPDPHAQPQFQQHQMYPQQTGSPMNVPQQQPPAFGGSPPPQQQFQQPQPQPQNPGMPPQQQSGTVYQNATPIPSLNRGPAPADCPACGQRSMTTVAYEVGNTTHAWALGLCCLVCLGCIPYVMNSLKDVQHKCGRCGVLLATWHRSGTTEVHIHS
ncbi:LITAF-like zinc ribbon domain-containing protein [Dendryphion nanum]|uniref:LITAF-like zinc ribbon domain-containing protein n=1 Tax=Dendryphion nanum TaxID=256645 RepID=A0A9P9EGY2_9PLEO|nr:LITAF-like zinc ribbon domain-containing protein [Dendryphion nanum]